MAGKKGTKPFGERQLDDTSILGFRKVWLAPSLLLYLTQSQKDTVQVHDPDENNTEPGSFPMKSTTGFLPNAHYVSVQN